jgi:hypothetical protein
MKYTTLALIVLVASACAGGGSSGADAVGGSSGADAVGGSSGADAVGGSSGADAVGGSSGADAQADAPMAPDAPPTGGPGYTRPPAGDPVSDEELSEVTALYLDLLEKTRYFAATAERVHGWPRSDPEGRYWYGTWWNGVTVTKTDGEVTYLHKESGSDNNGLRTGPILAAACYAHALWGDQEDLVRELLRGFNSWSMAWDRPGYETDGLLSRAAYPTSVTDTDHGGTIHIDYSLNRPGVELDEEDPPTYYIHNPESPHWGDLWVKNTRSKDDIGHMLQALAVLPACTAAPSAALAEDLALAAARYRAWCRKVEDDGYAIATLDADWTEYFPPNDLAVYDDTAADLECKGRLAIRLFGRDDPGDLDCGNGISILDEEWGLKNDFHQINRSHQEAAAAIAFLRGQPEIGDRMLDGLAWRLDRIMDAREADPEGYGGPHDQDLVELMVYSAAAGLPLTSREVRFVHDRIREAHASYTAEALLPGYDVLDPSTPDGTYPYNPGGAGFFWRDLGVPLGTCASPWANPASMPVFDCAQVKAAF